MEWCEKCQDYKETARRRPDLGGRTLCNDCDLEALRRLSPTGLVRRPGSEETWPKRRNAPTVGSQ